MRRRSRRRGPARLLLAAALAVGAHGCTARTATCVDATEPVPGYRALFDGSRASFATWEHAGEGGFVHTEGCALGSSGGMGLAYVDEVFEAPYTLHVDWRVEGAGNSGVFVGFPAPDDDPWVAVEQGLEVQITTGPDPGGEIGAIYDRQPADTDAVARALAPPGEWNSFDIDVRAQRIVVRLNGTEINDHVVSDPEVDLATGRVGLQNHGPNDVVLFRDVRIAEGASAAPSSGCRADFRC